ncbi:hypothetical protein D3C77_393020 [compost metagenome]
MVAAKFGSLPSAAANSFRVSNASGEDPTNAARAAFTNAVLAAWVLLAPTAAVGTLGIPVNSGLASGALRASA